MNKQTKTRKHLSIPGITAILLLMASAPLAQAEIVVHEIGEAAKRSLSNINCTAITCTLIVAIALIISAWINRKNR